MTTRKKRRAKVEAHLWQPDLDAFKEQLDEFLGVFAKHTRPVAAVIPPELFKKMLFLCHPDKHNDHPWAGEVTQWLLEQRKKHV